MGVYVEIVGADAVPGREGVGGGFLWVDRIECAELVAGGVGFGVAEAVEPFDGGNEVEETGHHIKGVATDHDVDDLGDVGMSGEGGVYAVDGGGGAEHYAVAAVGDDLRGWDVDEGLEQGLAYVVVELGGGAVWYAAAVEKDNGVGFVHYDFIEWCVLARYAGKLFVEGHIDKGFCGFLLGENGEGQKEGKEEREEAAGVH